LPEDELVEQIKALIGELPTYGYRRVHAILKRQALAAGLKPATSATVFIGNHPSAAMAAAVEVYGMARPSSAPET
jgi:hypothetical protein